MERPRRMLGGAPKRVSKTEAEAQLQLEGKDETLSGATTEAEEKKVLVAEDTQMLPRPTSSSAAVDDRHGISKNKIGVPLPDFSKFDEIQARRRQPKPTNGTRELIPLTEKPLNDIAADSNVTGTTPYVSALPSPPPMTIAADRRTRQQQQQRIEQHQYINNAQPQVPPQQHATQPSVLASVTTRPTNNLVTSMLGTRVEVDGCGYRIIKEIGKGGMSTVFCALREDDPHHKDSLVALKQVIGTENVNALKQEIELLVKLRKNPYVIQYIGHDVSVGSVGTLVMELGQADISSCVNELSMNRDTGKKDLKLHRNTVRFFFQGMIEAVQAIHDCRIVHGDLKPANFVFVKGRIKLIDFGIAKSISDGTVNIYRDHATGTMNYIPPEALAPSSGDQYKLSCKADVWSLGCILYSLVYGHPPFHDITHVGRKISAILDSKFEIQYPESSDSSDGPMIDAMKQCLQREVNKRIGIPGPQGLLAHPFLSPSQPQQQKAPQGFVSYRTFHQAIRAMTQVSGKIAAFVSASDMQSAVDKINRFTNEFVDGVVRTDRVMESMNYALSADKQTALIVDKENYGTRLTATPKVQSMLSGY